MFEMNGVDELLRRILPELGAVRKASPVEAVRMAWPAVVGAALSRLAAPGRFDPLTGLLEVRVEAPWREALYRMRHLLIERVRAVNGEIRGVRLVTVSVGTLRDTAAATPAPPKVHGPPPAPDARTLGIGDPALRAALDALCRAWDGARDH
jgi:hypothetical protein